ncbi:hypothetical protein [Pseudobdellovibrio sp. HCB154]|uniref:hypothetical protein n=1 Tax=Pseudobdellovibrio sp. HCB154 TaxID=3386277 RepID=UPI003916D6D8
MSKFKFSYFILPCLISSSVFAYMDLKTSRGEKTLTFAKNEICVIPRKFPNIDPKKLGQSNYSAKDLESELELCRMDFQAQTPVTKNTTQNYAVGICPKLHNTNPGLEIYEIGAGFTKQSLETKICDMPSNLREGTKLAKYKLSTSCSYTPSILAYYHVSRIMGDILKVPPVVLRTMDAEAYKAVPAKGKKTLSKGGVIAATWKAVINQLNNPATDKRGPYLFTNDYMQTFGGLMKNAKGEAAWLEISNDAGGEQMARGKAFMQEQVYLDLINTNVATKIVSQQWTQDNVQRLRVMGDAADMLVMDYLLRQEDRFNNIAYKLEVTGLVKGADGKIDIKSLDVKKADSAEELNSAMQEFMTKYGTSAFPVRRMMLKDNDCGVAVESAVARTGIAEKLNMLTSIRHMKKSTYDQLQRFHAYLSSSSTGSYAKDFFMRETMMTDKDYAQFALNTKRLAEGTKSLCNAGQLHLDLQLETHFSNSYKTGSQNCIVN